MKLIIETATALISKISETPLLEANQFLRLCEFVNEAYRGPLDRGQDDKKLFRSRTIRLICNIVQNSYVLLKIYFRIVVFMLLKAC